VLELVRLSRDYVCVGYIISGILISGGEQISHGQDYQATAQMLDGDVLMFVCLSVGSSVAREIC